MATRSGSGVPVVQRHSSWEHALLGDTSPRELGRAAVTREARAHVLADLWMRMRFFADNPCGDPRSSFPDVRWVKLRTSGLWVSNGELNALADYLPDPTTYDTRPYGTLVPVLQRMRGGIRGKAGEMFGLHGTSMKGEADSSWLPGAAGEVQSLDTATESLGTNRYAGLLARNACHFAPLSWQRWTLYHDEAIQHARVNFAARGAVAPLGNLDLEVAEAHRQAILTNGYADHFLQDSFAAGHLVNKTLVMQWFVDYLNGLSWVDQPWFGMPDNDVLARMGSGAQPGIAGRDRYGHRPTDQSSSADRAGGRSALDPQSAQERQDVEGRVAGSGVTGTGAEREANYQAYLRFLNSAFLQLAPGAVHDFFNERGLTVVTGTGVVMRVGGDDTLLAESDQRGAAVAAEAAAMSRLAVEDVLRTGTSTRSNDQILAMTPQRVRMSLYPSGVRDFALEEFQDSVLHPLCQTTLFPQLVGSFAGAAVRGFSAELVEGGISPDSPGQLRAGAAY